MTNIERVPISSSPEERTQRWGLRLAGEVTDAIFAGDDSYVIRDRQGVAGQLHDPEVYAAMARHIDDAEIEVHRFWAARPILLKGSSNPGEIPARPLTYDVVLIEPSETGILEVAQLGEHVERLYPNED